MKGNKTAYGEFFKWKQHVKFEAEPPNLVCAMCIKLNLEEQFGIQQSIVRDMGTYWNQRDCKISRTETMIVFKHDEHTDLNRPSQYMISLLESGVGMFPEYRSEEIEILFPQKLE